MTGAGAWAVAVVLTLTLATDIAAVAGIRAEQREQARAAIAEREATWTGDVRELALAAQAARAPLADAQHLVLLDLGPAVRYDVFVRGGAAADFAALQQRLAAVVVPGGKREAHDALSVALAAMAAAVTTLANEQDPDKEDELRAFGSAVSAWDNAFSQHVASDLPLATTDRGQLPLTSAGRIYRWSSACAEAVIDDERLGEAGEDPRQAAEVFDGSAANLDAVLDRVLDVPIEQPATAASRELESALRGLRPAASALRGFATALRQDDRDGALLSLEELDRVDPLFEAVSRAFEVAGSAMCSGHFDPGLLDPNASPGDETQL